jgi:hypothetical protein
MKSAKPTKSAKRQADSKPNKLCSSCRRTCKQAANAVVAQCPRYYPFKRTNSKQPKECTWKQMELLL